MATSEPWTVERLLGWTTDYLKKQGAEQPRLEADLLLAHACGCERIELYTQRFKEEPDEAIRTSFRSLVKRRAEGEPTAYLLGRKEFYSLPFRVTADVLIPRPETEYLVMALLDEAGKRTAELNPLPEEEGGVAATAAKKGALAKAPAFKVIDVGTGSGAIAICAAKYLPASQVTAVDISAKALVVAEANAVDLEVSDRMTFLESDLLEAIPANARFDFVCSNPPYISQSEFDELPNLIKGYEPTVALLGGQTGCEVIERLIPQAAERLEAGGYLIMEISPMIEAPVHNLITADGHFDPPSTTKDLAGLPRIVRARRKVR
ncbi:peptide chain release factor N(5)-glutamine methyltransferase [Lignipirellula cremea]|uniref:Release factor glutamine methyltransferase n=1 Tax=Lignipirellula cremea TaxID=2528010 RepID=A0A518DUK1_9BACT|nr:peptide chain release factor N(5)-glutamine methyltransferase [Lignipirellula cremea]QDU95516.1 Release factor glutamine methyltransferase [Lignipirellula cremea]